MVVELCDEIFFVKSSTFKYFHRFVNTPLNVSMAVRLNLVVILRFWYLYHNRHTVHAFRNAKMWKNGKVSYNCHDDFYTGFLMHWVLKKDSKASAFIVINKRVYRIA